MPDNETTTTKEKLPDLTIIIGEMQKKIEELTLKLTTPPKEPPQDDAILARIKVEKETKEKESQKLKDIEDSMAFNLMSELFLKENSSILPPETSKVFEAANKEKYESQLQKTNAIKSSLVQSFFRIQDNVDMLTNDQKAVLDNFLKLTKDAKETEASHIYSQIMEPTLLTVKKSRKAEELAKSKFGYHEGTDQEKEYEKMLIKKSENYYMGVKNGS